MIELIIEELRRSTQLAKEKITKEKAERVKKLTKSSRGNSKKLVPWRKSFTKNYSVKLGGEPPWVMLLLNWPVAFLYLTKMLMFLNGYRKV